MVNDQRSEFVTVKDDTQAIRDARSSHVAAEHVICGACERVMDTRVTITSAPIGLLPSIIGYQLVNPVGPP